MLNLTFVEIAYAEMYQENKINYLPISVPQFLFVKFCSIILALKKDNLHNFLSVKDMITKNPFCDIYIFFLLKSDKE